MKKIIVALLIAAAGCATPRAPEPAAPSRQEQPPARLAPAPVPERTTEPVKPAAPSATAPERLLPLPKPTAPVTAEPSPGPSTAAALPPPGIQEMPAPLQPVPRREVVELPVPDHKLEGLARLAAVNDEKLLNVFVGMERKAVEEIMGSGPNPYKRQTITGNDGQVYEVLFYLNREPRKGKPITERMLTPVIFKNGQVIALGTYPLKKLRRTGNLSRPRRQAGAVR